MGTPTRKTPSPGRATWLGDDLRTRLEKYERRLILEALDETGGHQARAAEVLGVLPTTLHEKMKRLGIHLGPAAEQLEEPDSRERVRLAAALAESGGHPTRAAAALHMSPRRLREKVKIHRLAAIREPAPPPDPAVGALDAALAAAVRGALAGLRRRLKRESHPGDLLSAAPAEGNSAVARRS